MKSKFIALLCLMGLALGVTSANAQPRRLGLTQGRVMSCRTLPMNGQMICMGNQTIGRLQRFGCRSGRGVGRGGVGRGPGRRPGRGVGRGGAGRGPGHHPGRRPGRGVGRGGVGRGPGHHPGRRPGRI